MKLFLLTSDCGDGSRAIHFTLDRSVVEKYGQMYESGELDYDSPGCDGDGFSYYTLTVPDGSTYESLGITQWQILN